MARRPDLRGIRAKPLLTAASVLGVAACAVASAGCGSAQRRATATTFALPATTGVPTSVTTSSTPSPRLPTRSTNTPVPPTTAPTTSGVGVIAVDVTDPSRPTVSDGRTLSPVRHLPTTVRYPATGTAPGAEVAGAPPAPGPWPLVVFGHGYDVTPATYAHLLHAWAAAGFVVAAPAFPLETAGGPLDENDLANEPGDFSAVISAVLARSAGGPGPLTHLVAAGPVAVAGHSDGGEAALGAGFAGPHDARIGPVIAMAAQGVDGLPHPDPRHPLLVVQGTADTINPPTRGDRVYAYAGPPRFELHLLGAGHLPPDADPTPWRPIVEQVTIDFLRRYLSAGGVSRITVAALVADGTRPGLATLTADP